MWGRTSKREDDMTACGQLSSVCWELVSDPRTVRAACSHFLVLCVFGELVCRSTGDHPRDPRHSLVLCAHAFVCLCLCGHSHVLVVGEGEGGKGEGYFL